MLCLALIMADNMFLNESDFIIFGAKASLGEALKRKSDICKK